MRLSFDDIKNHWGNVETYDIINALRNENPEFKDYIPLANAENVAEVGAALLQSKRLQNDFITALVDRIGLEVIRSASLKNPLSKFKKGTLEYGRQIEEIFVDIMDEHKFDPEVAETEVFKREQPNVQAIFHEVNREGFFKVTVQDATVKRAFVSWDKFEEFTSNILASLYNSDEVHEYAYMKLVMENYYANGLFKVEPITAPIDVQSSKDFVKRIRLMARKMTLESGSRDFNAMAVHTRSDMDGLHLFITPEIEAEVGVEVLAYAFNMDKTDFMGHVTVIDDFASPGLEAILVDERWFMVYDTVFDTENQRNSQGLYTNYFLHHQQLLSASRYSNAVAFVSGEVPSVTNVIVDPLKSSIKAGREMQFKAYVRQTDDSEYPVTWSVAGVGGAKHASTTINTDGVLSVHANETRQLEITATVTFGDSEDPETVKSEARVIVIPND